MSRGVTKLPSISRVFPAPHLLEDFDPGGRFEIGNLSNFVPSKLGETMIHLGVEPKIWENPPKSSIKK